MIVATASPGSAGRPALRSRNAEMYDVALRPTAPKRIARHQISQGDNLASSVEKRSSTARAPGLHQVGVLLTASPIREDLPRGRPREPVAANETPVLISFEQLPWGRSRRFRPVNGLAVHWALAPG